MAIRIIKKTKNCRTIVLAWSTVMLALVSAGCFVSGQQEEPVDPMDSPNHGVVKDTGPVREMLQKRLGGHEGKKEDKKKPAAKSNFANLWYDAKADWARLKKINVSPVETIRAVNDEDWKKLGDEKSAELKAETEKLAVSMKQVFGEEIKARSQHSWQLVEKDDDETAVLMLSILKVVPAKAGEGPEITMEGRIVDHKSSVTIMIFSDTKKCTLPADAKAGLGNANEIARTWGASFAEMTMPCTDPQHKDNHDKLKKAARMMGMHFMIRQFMD